jgi:ATP-binding cassette subfamily F protein 3
VFKEVRLLSGGERSRLEFALLGIMPSNLLLLDEPTNHLDIPAREAIESFMLETPATVLLVSHDRRLLDTVCDRLWVVDDRLAVPFDGSYRAWREAVAAGWTTRTAAELEANRLRSGGRSASESGARVGVRTPVGRADGGPGSRGPMPPAAAGSTPRPAGRPRRRLEKLSKDASRRQKAGVEAELTRLGLRKSHLELAMGDPSVQANFVELRRITSELADIETALGAAEDAWLELEERAP